TPVAASRGLPLWRWGRYSAPAPRPSGGFPRGQLAEPAVVHDNVAPPWKPGGRLPPVDRALGDLAVAGAVVLSEAGRDPQLARSTGGDPVEQLGLAICRGQSLVHDHDVSSIGIALSSTRRVHLHCIGWTRLQ